MSLEGFDEENEVNIDAAEALIEELELLPKEELATRLDDLGEMLKVLRDAQRDGIDTPKVRAAIATLSRLDTSARS